MEKQKLLNIATIFSGSGLVTGWTLFRFHTKSINFDLVGQQLLSRQWIDGNFEGAMTAPTNYILKMLTIYAPADLLNLDPKWSLIFSTILINIITFVGLYFILRRILQYFSIVPGNFFNLSMLWLASVAGSVFWIQFANSRNLELIAGLFVLYSGLLLYRELSLARSLVFVLLAALTYFADPLQLFVTTIILLGYVLIDSFFFGKEKRNKSMIIMVLVVAGYILSQLLTLITKLMLGVDYFGVSSLSQSLAIFSNIPTAIIETAKNTIRLIAGTNEMGTWRQMLNVLLVSVMSIAAIFSLLKGRTLLLRNKRFIVFVSLMLITPVAAYVASGQPIFKTDTSRYLIVLAPALVLLFSVIDTNIISKNKRLLITIFISILIAVNIVSLSYSTIKSMDGVILKSSRIESRFNFLKENGYSYGYSSMDTAIPAMYLYGKDSDYVLLPLSCDRNNLRKATLFYDKNVFITNEKANTEVPIILDGATISNYPNTCSVYRIQELLGDPVETLLKDENTILIYDSSLLANLDF